MSHTDPPQAGIHEYVSALHRDRRFQGVVLVTRRGEIAFRRGYGFADIARRRANTVDTVFPIGSITKQFTAAAVLQLVERGEMSLDQPLGVFFPAHHAIAGVTVQQLLTHTSGLPAEGAKPAARGLPLAELVALQRDVGLEHPPGARFVYSNLGYTLLAYAVEQASGQPFCRYLADRVFEPAGMRHARCCGDSPAGAAPVAIGYARNADALEPKEPPDFAAVIGAGNACATASDLAAWSAALAGGPALTEFVRERMLTRPIAGQSYGYGVSVDGEGARRRVGHNGAIRGFRSLFLFYPDAGLTVIALANLQPVPLQSLQDDLPAIAFGERREAPAEQRFVTAPSTRAVAAPVIGRYRLIGQPDYWIIVAYRNDQIVLIDDDGEEEVLVPTTRPGVFVVRATKELVEFELDRLGTASSAVYHTIEGWDAKLERAD